MNCLGPNLTFLTQDHSTTVVYRYIQLGVVSFSPCRSLSRRYCLGGYRF